MKIIELSATPVDEINPEEILKKLELCGRVNHKSKTRDDSAEMFVPMTTSKSFRRSLSTTTILNIVSGSGKFAPPKCLTV